MEILSPKSTNMPVNKTAPKNPRAETKPKPEEKPQNPDRIDEKWRPPPTITEPGTSPETFVVGKKLGKGGFAVCFEGLTQSKAELFALKVVKSKFEQKKMMEKFRTELQIHAKMQHPNIVEFLRAFTMDGHTYVVLELCPNGNLTDMVKARNCLSLPEVRRFMIQICGGVRYLHKRSVIHRDLKMGNIFLDSRMNLKIGDFGLAAVMADEADRRTTLCGTPNYIAPEILSKSGNRGHDNKVDTWAIGVICYAMLMGTPPFQSKTQQEIYAKLRTLEYEWKIDSKNYIPHQAKDFVASCLNLVSAERPEMDDLVEHEFFKMGAIANVLDTSCLRSKPLWLENADPRGDRVQQGYGVAHADICKECGVGRTADGRPRPAVGGKANISTLVEIELENREGSAPTVPLPEGVLYQQFSEARVDWSLHQKRPLQPLKPRSRKLNAVLTEVVEVAEKTSEIPAQARPTSMAPPVRPVQSFAAQQRSLALPQRPAQKKLEEREVVQAVAPQEAATDGRGAVQNQGLLKARPVRAASMRVTRSASQQVTTNNLPKTLPKSTTVPATLHETIEEKPLVVSHQSGLTASRAISNKLPSQERLGYQSSDSKAQPHAALPIRPVSNDKNVLTKSSSHLININSMSEAAVEQQETNRTKPKITKTDRPRSNTKLSAPAYSSVERLITSVDSYTTLSRTSGQANLEYLYILHQTLAFRSSNELNTNPTTHNGKKQRFRQTYPRIDKWVDYAAKKGMAYMLSDGTMGMVLRSWDDNRIPAASVVLRDAREHSVKRAQGTESQLLPQGRRAAAIEFYEQCQSNQEMRKLKVNTSAFFIDVDQYGSQNAAINAAQANMSGSAAERMKEIIWADKFAKYMHKKVEMSDLSELLSDGSQEIRVVRFFQRLGNVGIWAFDDCGLQFNFPDHTKLTIHKDKQNGAASDEFLVDLVHLDLPDAKELVRCGALTRQSLERRRVLLLSLREIQTGRLSELEEKILKANEVREKLDWIQAVVGCWVKNGGMGRMGEERLGWSGLSERREDQKTKLQWITVGRLGGDDHDQA